MRRASPASAGALVSRLLLASLPLLSLGTVQNSTLSLVAGSAEGTPTPTPSQLLVMRAGDRSWSSGAGTQKSRSENIFAGDQEC